MKYVLFAIAALTVGSVTNSLAAQPCTRSYWVNQGSQRVKVCCDQQNFCFTKFGVYPPATDPSQRIR